VKEAVGEVTELERNAIQHLHERRNGLEELLLCVGESSDADRELRERVMRDRAQNDARYSQWWAETAAYHGWKGKPNAHWELDFGTRRVYLVPEAEPPAK
jgi:CXXX repeat modification system protein